MTDSSELGAWAARLAARLGLPPEDVDVPAVLDLARDAAHAIARPAAPVTAYLVGIAVGRGASPAGAAAAARELWDGQT